MGQLPEAQPQVRRAEQAQGEQGLRVLAGAAPASVRIGELRTSYTPGVTEHSPLTGPDPLPGTWLDNPTAHTRSQPATATVRINARPATPHDAALQLPPGTCVLTRATTTAADTTGAPIDHTVSVWPEATTIAGEVPLT
ncbi:hypothetical protein ACQEU6_07800 [Spirillospora sp. CA-108201]